MKLNRKIGLLILIISIALAGLISLQIYFLKNAYDQKEQAFKRNVINALNNTALKIETGEAVAGIFDYVVSSSHIDSLHKDIDTIITKQLPSPVFVVKSFVKDTIHESKFDTTITRDNKQNKFFVKMNVDKKNDSTKMVWQYRIGDSSFNYSYEIGTEDDGKLNKSKKRIFVSNIVDRLAQAEIIPIEKRIKKNELDSILRKSLLDVKIDIPFHFAVYNGLKDSLKYALGNDSAEVLKKSDLMVNLFPADIFPIKNILTINFPGQSSLIYKQIFPVLTLSFLFTAIIAFSFVFTVRTIIKQKKLGELIVDFINNMTHEFKTPISTITLATEAIEQPEVAENKEKLSRYYKIIREENQRMEQQVDKILQMAVIEEGDYELNLDEINMHELIKNTSHNIVIQVEARGGNIAYDLKAEKYFIYGDLIHLTNVINNILDNANKYSTNEPQMRITTENKDGKFFIIVSDNGIGIDDEDIKKIFDKYYRVPTGNRHDIKGFGLGLSYVKLMIEAHKGEIKVNSRKGKGTSVEISFPLEINKKNVAKEL